MHLEQKILIAGARGMVGGAITRALLKEGYAHLLTPTRAELDLIDQRQVCEYLQQHRPDVVIVAAAKVGGIHANSAYPAQFLYDNLMIECNLIHQSHLANVPRLLFLGSTCIYPKHAPQPIPEEALLTGPLEPTNDAYALAKIAGIKLCQTYRQQYGRRYISAMPTNLYGPGDNYHLENGHVVPTLLRRFYEAQQARAPEVVMWGTGKPKREFLFVEDLAEACLFLLRYYDGAIPINIGSEEEVTVRELAESIAEVVGFRGDIKHDLTKPDGTPRKKSDTRRLSEMGWSARTPLQSGLKRTFEDFIAHAGQWRQN